jgi:hypothetical protein
LLDLILHLGAHRSGSTALVRCLQLNEAMLDREGMAVWSPEALRALPGFADLHDIGTRAALGGPYASRRLRKMRAVIAAATADLMGRGYDRLLISEENLIGTMAHNLAACDLYPDLRSRLTSAASLLPGPPLRIGIGIRGYTSLWPSAYGYCLPRQASLARFSAIAGRLAAAPRGWQEVVGDIRAVFPHAQIMLWQQEALPDHMARFVAALAGRASADGIVPFVKRVNRSSDASHADLIHLLREAEPGLRGAALAERIRERKGSVASIAPAFTDEQAAALDARYERDIAALRLAGPDIRLIG